MSVSDRFFFTTEGDRIESAKAQRHEGALTIRERPGKRTFRFWQEGGGYDRNIASNRVLRTAIDDVHRNPVRRGLCHSPGDWKWSSWAYYFGEQRWPNEDLPTVHGFEF